MWKYTLYFNEKIIVRYMLHDDRNIAFNERILFEVILIPPDSGELKLLQFMGLTHIYKLPSNANRAYSCDSSVAKASNAH